MTSLALLSTALLFGGMTLYSFGFAAFLFTALPAEVAGSTIRRAFPHFYLFVTGTATVAALLAWAVDPFGAPCWRLCGVDHSHAPDTDARHQHRNGYRRQTRFKWLHGASVLITLLHIGLSGWVLVRFLHVVLAFGCHQPVTTTKNAGHQCRARHAAPAPCPRPVAAFYRSPDIRWLATMTRE